MGTMILFAYNMSAAILRAVGDGKSPLIAMAVLDVAFRYLFIMAAFLPTAYLMHVYRGSLQGLGNSFAPMVSGGVEFAARVGSAVFLTKVIGETGIFFMDGLAWFSAWIFLMVCYIITFRKRSSLEMV